MFFTLILTLFILYYNCTYDNKMKKKKNYTMMRKLQLKLYYFKCLMESLCYAI